MLQSFYTGNSGLGANKQWLSVISDNIANVNTTGFKQERMNFHDLISNSMTTYSASGVPKNKEIGGGTYASGTIKDFSQGAFKNTNQPLSLALDGEGFFMVKNPTANLMFYTRDGDFRVDANGDVITQSGYKLQGWTLDENGNMAGAIGNINVPNAIDPKTTKSVKFEAPTNLNSADKVITKAFIPNDSTTYNYVNAMTIYDSLGNAHTASYYFQKVGNDIWNVYELIDGVRVPVQASSSYYDHVQIKFSTDGKISGVTLLKSASLVNDASISETSAASNTFSLSASNIAQGSIHIKKITGSASIVVNLHEDGKNLLDEQNTIVGKVEYASSSVKITITDPKYLAYLSSSADKLFVDYLKASSSGSASGNIDDVVFGGYDPNNGADSPFKISTNFRNITQVASDYIFYSQQDGLSKGDLMNISVTEDGVIKATYTNGKVKDVARLAVATFKDKEILVRKGDNLYLPNQQTFTPIIVPGGVISKIRSGMLEMSNVDISQEFINLITAQRAYQASAKTITTSDQILQTTMDIKR